MAEKLGKNEMDFTIERGKVDTTDGGPQSIYNPPRANVSLLQPTKPADPTRLLAQFSNSMINEVNNQVAIWQAAQHKKEQESLSQDPAKGAPQQQDPLTDPSVTMAVAEDARIKQATLEAGTAGLAAAKAQYPEDPAKYMAESNKAIEHASYELTGSKRTAHLATPVVEQLKVEQAKAAYDIRKSNALKVSNGYKNQTLMTINDSMSNGLSTGAMLATAPTAFDRQIAVTSFAQEKINLQKAMYAVDPISGVPLFTPKEIEANLNYYDASVGKGIITARISDENLTPADTLQILDGTYAINLKTEKGTYALSPKNMIGEDAYQTEVVEPLRKKMRIDAAQQDHAEMQVNKAADAMKIRNYNSLAVAAKIGSDPQGLVTSLSDLKGKGLITAYQADAIEASLQQPPVSKTDAAAGNDVFNGMYNWGSDDGENHFVNNLDSFTPEDAATMSAITERMASDPVFKEQTRENHSEFVTLTDGLSGSDLPEAEDVKFKAWMDYNRSVMDGMDGDAALERVMKTTESKIKAVKNKHINKTLRTYSEFLDYDESGKLDVDSIRANLQTSLKFGDIDKETYDKAISDIDNVYYLENPDAKPYTHHDINNSTISPSELSYAYMDYDFDQ